MKQKDNTQSFKETELSGVGDTTVTIIWSVYFIRAQGYKMTHINLEQDNKGVILLEKNSNISSSKWTKHTEQNVIFYYRQSQRLKLYTCELIATPHQTWEHGNRVLT
jgi:hypothetical protein